MLLKRIDLGSIPNGLYTAGEDITKGCAVVVKNGKAYLPSTKDEAENVTGFATLVTDDISGGDVSHHNVVKAGTKVVIYTLVKSNMWGTTEYVGASFTEGDKLSVAYTGDDKGKLVKSGSTKDIDDAKPLFEVYEVSKAGSYGVLDFYIR